LRLTLENGSGETFAFAADTSPKSMSVTLHDPDRAGVVYAVLPLSTNDARLLLAALHRVLGPIALPPESDPDDDGEDVSLAETLIDALADFVTDVVEGILDDDPEPDFLELPSDTIMRVRGARP
jgi:hypothetical protein